MSTSQQWAFAFGNVNYSLISQQNNEKVKLKNENFYLQSFTLLVSLLLWNSFTFGLLLILLIHARFSFGLRNCVKKRSQMSWFSSLPLLKDDRDHLDILVRIKESRVGGDDNGLRQLVEGGLHVEFVHPRLMVGLLLLLLPSTQHRLWQLEDLFRQGEDHRLRRARVL